MKIRPNHDAQRRRPALAAAITVVAALIQKGSRILICQRRKNDRFPLFWEFPGGKVQAQEMPEEALARELAEELGVQARIGQEIYRTRHRYPELDRELELKFFSASLDRAEIENRAFEQVLWAESAVLEQYAFLPADLELVRLLSRGELRLPPGPKDEPLSNRKDRTRARKNQRK